MQIDSHTKFVKHWDTKLKHMLTLLPEPAILTQYPTEYEICSKVETNKVRSGLYIKGFSPLDGFTRIHSKYTYEQRQYPYTSKAWSACFSFSKGTIVKDAPYDSECPYLFFGEEFYITLMLFTRGYYFFSPNENIVFTLFNRKYRRTFWQDIPENKRINIQSRELIWNRILNNINMGTSRSIEQYMKFSDIESIKDKKMAKCAKTLRTN